jgi:hypothetical protein
MARTKPAVRVHLSIAHHAKTSDAWATMEGRAVIVELLRLAAERFAGKTGGRVRLRPPDRLSVACVGDLTEADRTIERVCSEIGWRIDRYPNRWDVTIRNFARKQGFSDQESDTVSVRESPRTSASESESESESESKSEKKRDVSSPTGDSTPPPKRSNGSKVTRPDSFTGPERERILAWAERKKITRAELNAGLDRFREWAPLKNKLRTPDEWASSFMRIVREGLEDGTLAREANPDRKPKGKAYEEWRGYAPEG